MNEKLMLRPYHALLLVGHQCYKLVSGTDLSIIVRLAREHARNSKEHLIPDKRQPVNQSWIGRDASLFIVLDTRSERLWYKPVRKDQAYGLMTNLSAEFISELKKVSLLLERTDALKSL